MMIFAIVWLIRPKAIQYSMEASYYRDVLSEYGDGTMRSAHVIHTAPACTSILDSESEEEEEKNLKVTPRNSAEVEWVPIGESWRNEQLRLSLERGSSSLLVFPYSESSPHRDSLNREKIENEFARIDSIKRPRK
ncbi:hypothetical protein WR25_12545 [Diploscapter pachys]|uniref:Uncharacterized protein n=1 Tax=Diploscapter pachys TaxID=2018661 RepID=A0A2A2JRL5_9BILA|nr:hypothetical protein WR25_12545 [Diploscapter pachys]